MGPSISYETEPTSRLSFGSVLAWSVWVGLGSGCLELAIFWLKCRYLDPRNLNVSRHLVWMFPLAGLLVVGGCGIGIGLVSRLWKPMARPSYVLFPLLAVAYAGILFRAPLYTLACLILAAVLAIKSARFLESKRFWREGRVVRWLVIPLGLLALTVALSFSTELLTDHHPQDPRPEKSKNVILIVMDTVRASSLSLYGYSRETSPQLARLAGQGVRFDQAYSTAPWTAPSHASMFTGRWPHELSVDWDRPLDATFPTLAEVLGNQGYATAGFVANTTYCSYETGLSRGFAHYEDYDVTIRGIGLCSSVIERSLNFLHKHPRLAQWVGDDPSAKGDRKDAARINRDFLGWLEQRPKDQPFFAFLNYYDAHHPYISPESDPRSTIGRKPTSSRDFRLLKTWWERDKLDLKPEDLALAIDAYDQCIAGLDHQLGRLFDELKTRGILDESIVVITSDHGEHLGERNLFGHGCSVYRPELHVPLVILAPGSLSAGTVVTEPVSLRDIPATVLDLIHSPRTPLPGQSLATLATGTSVARPGGSVVRSEIKSPPEDDPNRGRSPAAKGAMTSLVDRDFHYIQGGDGHEELFNLKHDPEEVHDLARSRDQTSTLDRFRAMIR